MRDLLRLLDQREKLRGLRTAGIEPEAAMRYLDGLAAKATGAPDCTADPTFTNHSRDWSGTQPVVRSA